MIKVYPPHLQDSRSEELYVWMNQISNDPEQKHLLFQDYAFLVFGGDGTLIDAIHANLKLRPNSEPPTFFGVNRGTCGFLLNPIADKTELLAALKRRQQWNQIDLRMLKIAIRKIDGSLICVSAFNDFFVKSKTGEISGTVLGRHFPEQKFRGDGVIIASPQGSTAYNKSAGGSILPLGRGLISIASICSAIGDLRLVVAEQEIIVRIDRSNAIFCADRQHFDDCVSATVTADGPPLKLAFLPSYDFESRRYQSRFA